MVSDFELLSCSDDDTIKIIDTVIFKPVYDVYFKDQTVSSIDYDLTNRLIYTGHTSGSIKMFDDRVRNKIAAFVYESQNNLISQVKIN